MTTLEKMIKSEFDALLASYITLDEENILSFFDEDVMLIGTDNDEVYSGFDGLAKIFENEKSRDARDFDCVDSNFTVTQISDDTCFVHGVITLNEKSIPEEPFVFDLRISAVCRKAENGMKVRQLHLSQGTVVRLEHELFPHYKSVYSNVNSLYERIIANSAELEKSNKYIETLTDNLPVGVISCDITEHLNLLHYSDGFLKMLGYTVEDIENRFHNHLAEMIYHEDLKNAWAVVREQLIPQCDTKEVSYRIVDAKGELRWFLDRGRVVTTENGEKHYYSVLLDVTEDRALRDNLQMSLERHQIILNQANDVIFEWDVKKNSITFSQNYEKIFEHPPASGDIQHFINDDIYIHAEDRGELKNLYQKIMSDSVYAECVLRILSGGGEYLWCRLRISMQHDAMGNPICGVGVIINVDNEIRRVRKFQERAERDALTGLYNAGAMRTMTEKLLSDRGDKKSAFFIVDIDNFKQVNDFFGHLSGDVLLADMADTLLRAFDENAVVGRIGGDEFAVYIPEISDSDEAVHKAQQILNCIKDLFVDKGSITLSCSIGIAILPEWGVDYKTIYSNADVALYQAKQNGKNTCCIYSDTMLVVSEMGEDGYKTAVDEHVDSHNHLSVLSLKLTEYVFNMLYQSVDIETAIPMIFEIIGRQLNVSRVYICEEAEDCSHWSNTFEWCNDGISSQKELLKNIPMEDMLGCYDRFNSDGIFYSCDVSQIETLSPLLAKSLEGVKSVLQCVIKDNGVEKGYVGFHECTENRFWTKNQTDVLTMIAEIVCIFLLKKRNEVKIEQALCSLESILDHQNAWIYVINKDDYRLMYLNHKTRCLVKDIPLGTKCYEAFFGGSQPCKSCPLNSISDSGTYLELEVYSKILGRNIISSCTIIPWTGGNEGFLVSCRDKHKTNK